MFQNYLKTALRNLWRKRTYGLLNIVGLAVGITCATLIFLWVEDEVTFNHSHEKRDRIHMVMNNQTYDGTTYTFGATSGVLALLIALFTVSFQSLKAALANPVKSLRSE